MWRTNLFQKLDAGKTGICGWMSIPSPWTAEIMARAGFDGLAIDMQHGLMDYETVVDILRGLHGTDITPIVRVPWNEPSIIMKSLDAGAAGIVCPMINTRAEAEVFVSACLYAPEGCRSYGPYGPNLRYDRNAYFEAANDRILSLAMIETREALENVEDIASTPKLRGLFVGPKDLTISTMEQSTIPWADKVFQNHLKRIADAAHANGILACTHVADPNQSAMLAELGYDILFPGDDTKILASGAQALVQTVQNQIV